MVPSGIGIDVSVLELHCSCPILYLNPVKADLVLTDQRGKVKNEMASKLQYTYRSSAALSDDVIEYIKEGVEKAGSFPKFVDALVAASMSEGGDLQISSQAIPILPTAPAKVDLSGVERKIDDSRKDILAAILQRVETVPSPAVQDVNAKVDLSGVEERIDESRKELLAAILQRADASEESKAVKKDGAEPSVAAPTRDDLVALRRAIATDIVKAKEEEIEKLDEILGAIKDIELEPVVVEKTIEVSKAASEGVLEEPDESAAQETSDKPSAISGVSSSRAEFLDLPFNDDDFATGIKDLLGIDIDEVEVEENKSEADYDEPKLPSAAPSPSEFAYDTEKEEEDEKASHTMDLIDDETLLGAQVLLGMA